MKIIPLLFAALLLSGCLCCPFTGRSDEERDAYNRMRFAELTDRAGVTITGEPGDYCFDCYITYSNPGSMDITLTSEELSSYLQATNNENGPLKNIEVTLGDDNRAEMTCDADLSSYGYGIQVPVYASGTIEKSSSKTVKIKLDEVKSGPLPVPTEYASMGEDELNNLVNRQLAQMPGLQIDEFSIDGGQLHFKGDFPKTISA
ncbi:MAG TPA: hypothetical protein ENN13_03765 [Candidatus Altiarchaeales archaeon]|nr:hypothetical protein [Candidatus Altiarchaeales archaeon]